MEYENQKLSWAENGGKKGLEEKEAPKATANLNSEHVTRIDSKVAAKDARGVVDKV